MIRNRGSFLILFELTLALFCFGCASAQVKSPVVRVAKIRIDSAQVERYIAALREGIETALRVEPGVLALYAVADKDHSTHITVFEVYASAEAYKSHLETAHFKKYKNTTKEMVKSLELVETVPLVIGTKSKQ